MKHTALISVILMLPLLGGCDFLRSFAGRPTKAKLDSIRAQQEEAASRETPEEVPVTEESLLEMYGATAPETGYLIVVGAYRIPRHAERHAEKLRRRGYEVCIVQRGPLQAVGICSAGDRDEAVLRLRELRSIGICPRGAWILKNE